MPQPPVVKKTQVSFTEKELWEKYWQVTQELLKFIKAEDIDTFIDLVGQRQKLMEMLKAVPPAEQNFSHTPECTELKEKIKPLDMQIMYKARTWLNKSRRNNAQVNAYDGTSHGKTTGRSFNWQL